MNLPLKVQKIISGEKIDFAVKAERKTHPKDSRFPVYLGIAWTLFTGLMAGFFFAIAFPSPNFGSVLETALSILFGVFVIIGFILLGAGIYQTQAPGPWFIGTSKRVILYYPKKIYSTQWSQFSGKIKIEGTPEKGHLTAYLTTKIKIETGDGPPQYMPDLIYLVSIPQPFEIEKKMKKRIVENTPPKNPSIDNEN